MSSVELVCIGMSHHTAPLEVRERISLAAEARLSLAARLATPEAEVMVLDTCNRLEVYAVTAGTETLGAQVRKELTALGGGDLEPFLYERSGQAAAVHLFRVAASLDSMVLGEPQILGQLKGALAEAQDKGLARGELIRICSAAFTSAKRVRTETAIGRMATSMASVAVTLAQKIFGDLKDKTVLLLGAGAMGKLAGRSLFASGVGRMLVTSRTLERAQELAVEMKGEARSMESLPELLVEADLVVCSTAARAPIVTRELVERHARARKHRPLFFLDLAVPRDVHPKVAEMEDVYLFDLDDVQRAQADGATARAAAAVEAERIVAEEVARWAQSRAERAGLALLAQLRARAEAIARSEAERTLGQMGIALDERQKKSVEAMAMAIVNKVLHAPTTRLRAVAGEGADRELLDAAAELFGLEVGAGVRGGGKS